MWFVSLDVETMVAALATMFAPAPRVGLDHNATFHLRAAWMDQAVL
jgi:hypothetical protein